MLTIERLSLQRGDLTVFKDYSLQLGAERSCLVAANGAGKSSLLCAIAGLLPYHGTILWQQHLLTLPRQNIALASDSIVLPEFLTAADLIALQQKMWQTAVPTALIEGFRFNEQLTKTIINLSTGNLKKLQLILAIMRQPALLLLDEPNIALDSAACETLFSLLANYPGSIVVASNEPTLFAQLDFQLVPLKHDHGN